MNALHFIQSPRYLSTIKRISNWYSGKPSIKGTQAYKDLQVAHKLHLMMRRKLCQMDNEQINALSIIVEPWCPDHEILLKNFAMVCPFEKFGLRPYIKISESPYRPKRINNMNLTALQAVFVCMVLLRSQDTGIHNATDKDIDAFCHM